APAVAWASLPGSVSANATTTLRADASDDKGVARVTFVDDDRVVCADTAAPFTCDYRPRGADVGRNTLTAIASHAHGQTASAIRTVVVRRFAASRLSLHVTHSGRASGKLTVSSRATCSGSVRVKVKSVTRTARLSRGCRYSVRLPVTRGRVVASF